MKTKNNFRDFFIQIGKFVDKYIIVPITKLTLLIKSGLTKDSKKIEKLINKKSSLLIITLALSIILFIAIDSKSIAMDKTSAEVLGNQPVTVQYNEEAYVLEGVPETVDITLIGRSSDLYLAKQIPSKEVTLDLSGLKAGVHKVALKYTRSLDTIDYKLDPSEVTVTIYPKVSESRAIGVDILNADNLNSKLVIQKTEVDRDEVIIKGAQATLEKVATVKALVDINNIIDPKVGTSEIQDVPLIAYDENGNVISVEIVPSRVNATVTITSPQKTVPIHFIPSGTLSFGKAIESISGSINELTLYGEESVLNDISYIAATIDVNGLKDDKEYDVTLKKPNGVRYMSESVANVKVAVGEESSKEFSGINVQYKNLGSNYGVSAKSADDSSITVIVKGVSSILEQLDSSSIIAYVDLKDYKVGEHEVEVKVEQSDLRLTYVPKVKKITLTIKAKK